MFSSEPNYFCGFLYKSTLQIHFGPTWCCKAALDLTWLTLNLEGPPASASQVVEIVSLQHFWFLYMVGTYTHSQNKEISKCNTFLKIGGWKDGSVVKNMFLPRTQVPFPALILGGTQSPVTPAPHESGTFTLYGHCTCVSILIHSPSFIVQKMKSKIFLLIQLKAT